MLHKSRRFLALLALIGAALLTPAAHAQRALAPGQTARLVTLGVEGDDLRTVYVSTDAIIEAPNWTPDGKTLVFNGSGKLWRVPANGSAKPEQIPLGDVQGANNDHVLSPDGRTIYLSARGKLYSVPIEGGQPRQISNNPPADQPFTYWLHGVSPDGKTLVYTGAKQIGDDRWAKVDIYTIPAVGGPDVNLTDSAPYDDGPEYSPDGKWIYFNSERDAKLRGDSKDYRMAEAHIYRMRPDGTGIEQLTRDDRVNWFPHPSPDGKWIVYISFPPLTLGHPSNKDVIIRRMKPDGSERRDLIAFNGGQGTINVPSWSPDSRRFAFVMYPFAEKPAPKSASSIPPHANPTAIIDRITDDKAESRNANFAGSKTKIENVSAPSPVRGGRAAFRHVVGPSDATEANYRSEFAGAYTTIGETYWLGWSEWLPADFDYTASWLIIAQWAAYPPNPNRVRPLPGGGAGHHFGVRDNKIQFTLQHEDPANPNGAIVAPHWTVVSDVKAARGKWMDFVMHAKWTGNPDGFCKLWVQIDGKGYELKVDHAGRTWWNNEERGPYFKMGLYRNRQKIALPALELFTDEYRLGSAAANFETVRPDQPAPAAPPAKAPSLPAGTKVLRDVPYVPGGHERQSLDLYVPAGPRPAALVLSIHGGGWRQGNKDNPRGLRELLEAGFAVASLNYRYSQQAQFPAQLEDCKSAIRWLRAHAAAHGYDAERIGVWGGSAGGHLASLLGLTGGTREFDVGRHLEFSSAVQAVSNWYGPTDFLQMDAQAAALPKAMKHNPATSPESLLVGGAIQDHPDRVRRANPLTYVTKAAPPFQIYHGADDTSVPVGQSQILADALRRAGASVQFEIIPGDAHGLRNSGPRLVPTTVAFFARELRSTSSSR
jgi:TolB protein